MNKNFFNQLIPNANIKKITLSTNLDNSFNSNPYVDIEREVGNVRDPRTGKLKPQKTLTTFLKKNKNNTPEALSVNINIQMEDKVNNTNLSSWFARSDFQKYLKINLLEVRDLNLSNLLTENKDLIYLFLKSSQSFSEEISSLLSISKQEAISLIKGNIKLFNKAAFSANSDNSKLTRLYSETDLNGEERQIYSFLFQSTLSDLSPNFLSYFIFPEIDLLSLIQDNGIKNTSFIGDNKQFGEIKSELVFKNGELVTKSDIFLNEETSLIWTGNIEEENGEFFGISELGNRIPLRKAAIQFNKINDFRVFKQINEFESAINSLIETKFKKLENLFVRTSNPRQNQIGNYFSNLISSIDEPQNNNFIFGINIGNILEDKGKYNFLLKNASIIKNVVENSYIKNIKLVRTQVRGSTKLNTNVSPKEKLNFSTTFYGKEENITTIAISGENSFKQIAPINSSKATFDEIELDFVELSRNSFFRFFSCTDKTLKNVSDGFFIYEIFCELYDGTEDFMRGQFKKLQSSIKRLDDYYFELNKPYTFNGNLLNINPHIDINSGIRKEIDEYLPRNYNENIQQFSENFILSEFEKERASNESILATAIADYLEVLELFVDEVKDIKEELGIQILKNCHPNSGNPSSVLELKSLISKMLDRLSYFFNIDIDKEQETTSKIFGESSKPIRQTPINKTTKGTTISLIHSFYSDYIGANSLKNAGFDVLDLEGGGIKQITSEQFAQRAKRETDYYFVTSEEQEEVDINIRKGSEIYTSDDSLDNSKFTYFTPASVKLDKNEIVKRIGNSPQPSYSDADTKRFELKIKNKSLNGEFATPIPSSINETSMFHIPFVEKLSLKGFQVETQQFEQNFRNAGVTYRQLTTETDRVDKIVEEKDNCEANVASVSNAISILLELDKSSQSVEDITNDIPYLTPTKEQKLSAAPDFKNAFDVSNITRQINPTSPDPLKKLPIVNAQPPLSIEQFDLNSENNIINKLTKDGKKYESETFFQGAPHTTTIQDAIKALPNQIKSLIVGGINPKVVRKSEIVNANGPDFLKASTLSFKSEMDYKNIFIVKYIHSFQKFNGKENLQSPVWRPLTLQAFKSLEGKNILCSFFPYENSTIGFRKNPNYDLPVFNKVFLLQIFNTLQNIPKKIEPESQLQVDIRSLKNSALDGKTPLKVKASPNANFNGFFENIPAAVKKLEIEIEEKKKDSSIQRANTAEIIQNSPLSGILKNASKTIYNVDAKTITSNPIIGKNSTSNNSLTKNNNEQTPIKKREI